MSKKIAWLVILAVVLNLFAASAAVFAAKPTTPNLAKGATAIGDEYTIEDEDASMAIDGTVEENSKWCSVFQEDKWLALDLGKKVEINRYILRLASEGGETTDYNLKDFVLQKSDDNENWVDVDKVEGNSAGIVDRHVPNFSARYVRIYITVPTQTYDYAARIYEFELYNDPNTPDPDGGNNMKLKINSNTMTVKRDGQTETIELDAAPVIKDSRTFLPIRAVVEALGGQLTWDQGTQKITITSGTKTIVMTIGRFTATINGTTVFIDSSNISVAPYITNGRTMVPLRFVSENLGATVEFEQATQTITLKFQ